MGHDELIGKPRCGIYTTRGGKGRPCERAAGHTGRHMAYLCGKRIYWGGRGPYNTPPVPTGDDMNAALAQFSAFRQMFHPNDQPIYQQAEHWCAAWELARRYYREK